MISSQILGQKYVCMQNMSSWACYFDPSWIKQLSSKNVFLQFWIIWYIDRIYITVDLIYIIIIDIGIDINSIDINIIGINIVIHNIDDNINIIIIIDIDV